MAKVVFTDEERAAAKASGSLLFAAFVLPPENRVADGGFYKVCPLTPAQAEDLSDAIAAMLKKFKAAAG